MSNEITNEALLSEALLELDAIQFGWQREALTSAHPSFEAECRLIAKHFHRKLSDAELEAAAAAATHGVIVALVARGWRPPEGVE